MLLKKIIPTKQNWEKKPYHHAWPILWKNEKSFFFFISDNVFQTFTFKAINCYVWQLHKGNRRCIRSFCDPVKRNHVFSCGSGTFFGSRLFWYLVFKIDVKKIQVFYDFMLRNWNTETLTSIQIGPYRVEKLNKIMFSKSLWERCSSKGVTMFVVLKITNSATA